MFDAGQHIPCRALPGLRRVFPASGQLRMSLDGDAAAAADAASPGGGTQAAGLPQVTMQRIVEWLGEPGGFPRPCRLAQSEQAGLRIRWIP